MPILHCFVWACPFIPVTNWFLQRRKKSLNQIIVRIVKWKIDLYSSKTKLLENIFSLQQLSLSLSHWNTILSNQLRPTIIFILFTHLSANFIFHFQCRFIFVTKFLAIFLTLCFLYICIIHDNYSLINNSNYYYYYCT